MKGPPLKRFVLVFAAALAGCAPEGGPAGSAPSDRAEISLEEVVSRTGPSAKADASIRLLRGAPVQLRGSQGDWWRVSPQGGGETWVPSGSFERLSEKSAREKRASAVASFPGQPGRAVETCPILLAPDYGASRYGTLEDGDDVDVLLADHDFYGVRLPGQILAFVPARSIRLLPAPVPTAAHPTKDAVIPSIAPVSGPEVEPTPAAFAGATPPPPPTAAVVSAHTPGPAEPPGTLPSGSEPPLLVTRVDARYPEIARRMNLGGEVVLRVVVEANGNVGRVDVVSGGPAGMTEAAVDAVKRWVYRPARVDGRALAVTKIIRVRFSPVPAREAPQD